MNVRCEERSSADERFRKRDSDRDIPIERERERDSEREIPREREIQREILREREREREKEKEKESNGMRQGLVATKKKLALGPRMGGRTTIQSGRGRGAGQQYVAGQRTASSGSRANEKPVIAVSISMGMNVFVMWNKTLRCNTKQIFNFDRGNLSLSIRWFV